MSDVFLTTDLIFFFFNIISDVKSSVPIKLDQENDAWYVQGYHAFHTSGDWEFNQETLFLPLSDKGAKEWAF